MKEVILHIGHGKTGSSYLQSVFAANVPLLNRAGVAYPFHESFQFASKGFISSGNSSVLSIENIETNEKKKLFFSGEMLFHELRDSDLLTSLAHRYKLKVILYTRDIIEHALSRWAQGVKRGGLISDVDSYLIAHPLGPHRFVVTWIERAKSLNFELIIRNYTKNKSRLTSVFFLDAFNGEVNVDDLSLPHVENVNRGLTNSEYELQRVFNAAFGEKSSAYVSDFLVNTFPNCTPHSIKISKQTYNFIVEKNAKYLEIINRNLSSEEHISFGNENDFLSEKKDDKNLSVDIVESLGKNLKAHFEGHSLREGDVELLRDTALKIESGETLTLYDALALMQIALNGRPNGPLIKRKVDEWTVQLISRNGLFN